MLEGALSTSRQRDILDNYLCPGCGCPDPDVFFRLDSIPVHCNILWPTAEAARRAPRGDMQLAACAGCGLVFNAAFDAALVTYDASYENSLHYSPRFEAYADELARDLANRLDLRNRLVVEVGCGKGEFLRQLCRKSGAHGLGIDASYDPDIVVEGPDVDGIRFVREPFSTLPEDSQPALMFCRHVLEHIPDPAPFVAELTAGARRAQGCRVLIEVPNVLFTLRDLGIWDLIYEHCLYFSTPSLTRLCERAGLRVDRAAPVFGDQFLCVEASVGETGTGGTFADDVREVRDLATRFGGEYARKVDMWQRRLRELRAAGRKVVLWGAGSKGITFVNTVPGGAALSALVDLNPRKQGRFVPGTGQPVVAPADLRTIRPDVIVAMNPLYKEEIVDIARQHGLCASVETA